MITKIYDIMLLIGSVQALIMTLFLFFSKTNKLPNRLLSIMTISWSVTCLMFSLQSRTFWTTYPHLYRITSLFTYAFFPPLFLYTKYITTAKRKWEKVDILHFAPVFIYLLLHIPFYIKSTEEKLEILDRYFQGDPDPYIATISSVGNIVIFVQGIVYSALSIVVIYRYKKSLLNNFSNIEQMTFNWLRNLIVINFILWLIGSLGAVFEFIGHNYDMHFYSIFYLLVVLVIYFLSYYALKQPEVFKEQGETSTKQLGEEEQLELSKQSRDLENYFEDNKPYLNPKLTLQDLSEGLEVSKKQLSELINSSFNKNFFDFINDYRVNEAKKLITDPENKDYKLEYLARKAGFNSKASFNRIFKDKTGNTPTEYKIIHASIQI